MGRRLAWGLACALMWSCGGESIEGDAGDPRDAGDGMDGGGSACGESCDDGLFCNGIERCAPDEEGADPRGCVAGEDACAGPCDEDADACEAGCETPDADGDGHASLTCGGDDCDDTDPNRFPGNPELCDADDRDEDCDPGSLGVDVDGDGYVSDDCCNGDACGRDCDDDRAGVNPGAVDACGGGDEDCDGAIDEEPSSVFFRDQDGDNYGDDDDTLAACSQPSGYAARGGDCSDDPFADPEANRKNPGITEICNEVDDDCDAAIDEGLECACTSPGAEEPCGFDPALDGVGICRLGTRTCRPEGTYTMCTGATPPMEELCNLDDDDCDGAIDEGARVSCWADPDRDGYAASGAARTEECTCPDATTATDPAVSADCGPTDPLVHPGAPEVCNRRDDDCSRGGGDEPAEDADSDGHTAEGFTGCAGGFPKDDCFDSDGRVFTGQRAFHGRPYCPGLCACGDACASPDARGLCPICLGGMNGSLPGSYDFNCDGAQTREPSGDCFCRTGFSCNGDVPSYSGSPACGSSVSYLHCGSGGCGACGGTSPTTERLRCR